MKMAGTEMNVNITSNQLGASLSISVNHTPYTSNYSQEWLERLSLGGPGC